MEIENRIRAIVNEATNDVYHLQTHDDERSFYDIGMDSIMFISILVTVENTFSVEFPEEKLIMDEIGSIAEMANVVRTLVNGK